MNKKSGFSLVELSIALVIIAVIVSMLMVKGGTLRSDSRAVSTIAFIKDLSGAINTFKSRYRYLPGDLPKASDDIAGIVSGSACDSGDGNGLIDKDDEIQCVATHLVLAVLIKGDTSGLVSPLSDDSRNIDTTVRYVRTSQVNIAATNAFISVQNVIEIINVSCDAALVIDAKIDDGKTETGRVRTEPVCSPTTKNTTLDIAL